LQRQGYNRRARLTPEHTSLLRQIAKELMLLDVTHKSAVRTSCTRRYGPFLGDTLARQIGMLKLQIKVLSPNLHSIQRIGDVALSSESTSKGKQKTEIKRVTSGDRRDSM